MRQCGRHPTPPRRATSKAVDTKQVHALTDALCVPPVEGCRAPDSRLLPPPPPPPIARINRLCAAVRGVVPRAAAVPTHRRPCGGRPPTRRLAAAGGTHRLRRAPDAGASSRLWPRHRRGSARRGSTRRGSVGRPRQPAVGAMPIPGGGGGLGVTRGGGRRGRGSEARCPPVGQTRTGAALVEWVRKVTVLVVVGRGWCWGRALGYQLVALDAGANSERCGRGARAIDECKWEGERGEGATTWHCDYVLRVGGT